MDEHQNDGQKRIFLHPDGNWINAFHVEIVFRPDPLTVVLQTVSVMQHYATFLTPNEAQDFLELWLKRIDNA